MPFTKVPGSDKYSSPSGRKFSKKQVKMYYATSGFTKKKAKISVNNKMKRGLGRMDPKTNKVEINVKAHKGDKKELASTVKHELLHVKHPKMTEKEVYKKSRKTKILPQEQSQLLAKLRGKKIHYKQGALKRKFKMKTATPGDFISRMNDSKKERIISSKSPMTKEKVAIMGLV